MRVKNPKELFVTMLSQVRHGTELTEAVYRELANCPKILKYWTPSRPALTCPSKP